MLFLIGTHLGEEGPLPRRLKRQTQLPDNQAIALKIVGMTGPEPDKP